MLLYCQTDGKLLEVIIIIIMLPPKLQSILLAAGVGETLPQWQVTVCQSVVTTTLIWSTSPHIHSPSSPSQVSSSQVPVVSTAPTSDSHAPPPPRKHKSPSARRRDLRRRQHWRRQRRTGISQPPSGQPPSPSAQDCSIDHSDSDSVSVPVGMEHPTNPTCLHVDRDISPSTSMATPPSSTAALSHIDAGLEFPSTITAHLCDYSESPDIQADNSSTSHHHSN